MPGDRLERHDLAIESDFGAKEVTILADIGPHIQHAVDLEQAKDLLEKRGL